jgi:hypothetical protein
VSDESALGTCAWSADGLRSVATGRPATADAESDRYPGRVVDLVAGAAGVSVTGSGVGPCAGSGTARRSCAPGVPTVGGAAFRRCPRPGTGRRSGAGILSADGEGGAVRRSRSDAGRWFGLPGVPAPGDRAIVRFSARVCGLRSGAPGGPAAGRCGIADRSDVWAPPLSVPVRRRGAAPADAADSSDRSEASTWWVPTPRMVSRPTSRSDSLGPLGGMARATSCSCRRV